MASIAQANNTITPPAPEPTLPARTEATGDEAPPQDQPAPTPIQDPHAEIASDQYGHNTPTKRSSHSNVWTEVKRLKGELNNEANDGTHICLCELKERAVAGAPKKFCNTILKLHKRKATPQSGAQTWLTTRAADHLQREHPVDSPSGAIFASKARAREGDLIAQQMSFGMPTAGGVVGSDTISMFRMTKKGEGLVVAGAMVRVQHDAHLQE